MICCRRLFSLTLQLSLICAALPAAAIAQSTADSLQAIRGVSHQAEGNAAAKEAYQSLIKHDRSVLPEVLKAFNGANPLAANYLRSAFEVLVADGKGEIPVKELQAYLADRDNNQKARAMVFEYLSKQEPDKMNALLDNMLDDPSAGIRYQAVQKVIDQAKAFEKDGKQDQAVAAYRRAMEGATQESQVKAINEALKKAGVNVDLQQHFGLLTDWRIIGPFDNTDESAFDVVYPPEKELDFSATYDGKTGKVSWQVIGTDQDMGTVDIAKSIAPHKGSVMYMYTEYISPEKQDVYVRMATSNAWKLWVNDELVFAREEYHRGMRWDQYRVPVSFQKGRNRLLLKILQNEQTQSWAQDYSVQFRITDESGKALLPTESYDPAK